MKIKNRLIKRILYRYGENITGLNDLLGGQNSEPSALFYLIAAPMSRYLEIDASKTINTKSIWWRKKSSFLVKKIGKLCLPEKQVIENRYRLLEKNSDRIDRGITLPKEPVIYISNHGFMDDVLASVLTAERHTYFVTNGLPEMCNSIDGVLSWFNGVILANHRVKATKQAVVPKAVSLLQHGTDLVIFPEGVWNKTPNKLVLDLWPGIYKIALESGAMVVPIVHYIEDPIKRNRKNTIHTVVDDPFRIDHLSQTEALQVIRDKFATWQYLMMEQYGQAKRNEIIPEGATADDIWVKHLSELLKTCDRYDKEMETSADYRPHVFTSIIDVWKPISQVNINTDTVSHIIYAKKILDTFYENDYQRRF